MAIRYHQKKYNLSLYLSIYLSYSLTPLLAIGETSNSSGPQRELLWLGTIGWGKKFFMDFVETSRKFSYKAENSSTVIYIQDGYRGSGWKKALQKKARQWESVILDGDIAESVYSEVTDFLGAQEYYLKIGIPYRRSFLLESPPGCGKSSFIASLAGRLGFDICYLSLGSQNLTDRLLQMQIRGAPPKTLILLEDVDVAFPDRSKATLALKEEKEKSPFGGGRDNGITLSGLLNAIDGLVAAEGKLIFFTTNHLEMLDPALLRPGRVDRVISLKLASHSQIRRLFLRFFPGRDSVAQLYARSVPEFELSMAQVQGHLLRHKDPLETVATIKDFCKEVTAIKRRRDEFEKKMEQKAKIELGWEKGTAEVKAEKEVERKEEKKEEAEEEEDGDERLVKSVHSLDEKELEKVAGRGKGRGGRKGLVRSEG